MLLLEDRKVELVCSDCGYGIVTVTAPEACPMCHGSNWDMPAWRPFSGLAAFRARPEPDEAEL
jgi:Zn finger protein HypA/HybF involved in hydrogenase expression